VGEVYEIPAQLANAHITPDKYAEQYAQSIQDPAGFWGAKAKELLSWSIPFEEVRILSPHSDKASLSNLHFFLHLFPHSNCQVVQGGFDEGDVAWFSGGRLNVSYNCVDRHAKANPDKVEEEGEREREREREMQ
jgi:acetyl-CoA synthetase